VISLRKLKLSPHFRREYTRLQREAQILAKLRHRQIT